MSQNEKLSGAEMETMTQLGMTWAGAHVQHFGSSSEVNFDKLIDSNAFGYAEGLRRMKELLSTIAPHFQTEFTFNIIDGVGVFHPVQFKLLRAMSFDSFTIPADGKQVMMATDRVKGHGILENLQHIVVVSPFTYRPENQSEVRQRLNQINREMIADGNRYILLVPGRLGSINKEWGIHVDFPDISGVGVIVEYGYDIHGADSVPMTKDEYTGGHFGSHFLWQILGGAEEAEKVRALRMEGSQGTHFITNLMTTGAFYLHIDPNTGTVDPLFFSPPEGSENEMVFIRHLPTPLTAYANLHEERCVIK
jgi:hypothetical protein